MDLQFRSKMLETESIKLPRAGYEEDFTSPVDDDLQCLIDHFTVACPVTWPLNSSEAEGDLVLIQTSLILLCKSSCFNAN